jgi:hypothetical protein
MDGTNWSGGCTGSDAAISDGVLYAQLLEGTQLSVDDTTGTQRKFFLIPVLGRYWCPAPWNSMGVALSGTAADHGINVQARTRLTYTP